MRGHPRAASAFRSGGRIQPRLDLCQGRAPRPGSRCRQPIREGRPWCTSDPVFAPRTAQPRRARPWRARRDVRLPPPARPAGWFRSLSHALFQTLIPGAGPTRPQSTCGTTRANPSGSRPLPPARGHASQPRLDTRPGRGLRACHRPDGTRGSFLWPDRRAGAPGWPRRRRSNGDRVGRPFRLGDEVGQIRDTTGPAARFDG